MYFLCHHHPYILLISIGNLFGLLVCVLFFGLLLLDLDEKTLCGQQYAMSNLHIQQQNGVQLLAKILVYRELLPSQLVSLESKHKVHRSRRIPTLLAMSHFKRFRR